MSDAPPANASTDGTLAGHRLLRKLGTGSRADVFLASGSTGTVALKVFDAEVSRESVGAELDALGRIESPHLVRLLDVASSHTLLPTLVLERVRRGSVLTLLTERVELEPGEAVTLLAPLAGLLTELHRAGIAHEGIGPASVHLGAGGEPVLLGLGHCTLFAANGTMAALDGQPAVVRDRDALATLTLAVLRQVRAGAADRQVRELADWIETTPRLYEFAPDLESRLFELADAMPIEFAREAGATSAVPTRIGMPVPIAATRPEVVEPPADGPHQISLTEALPHWLPVALLENPMAMIRERLGSLVRGVRKPLWFVAGGIVLAFVLALALIPAGSPHNASKAAIVTRAATPKPTEAALPDDPLLALPILLRAREACIRNLSILCLDAVDESSSGAFIEDSALIQRIQQGGELSKSATIDFSGLTLVERLGGSALLSLGTNDNPASVLVIKGASGWRIRDYLSGVQATNVPPAPTP
jgi:eukaryotic-like serine/threonine-protein kinase